MTQCLYKADMNRRLLFSVIFLVLIATGVVEL